MNIQINYFTGTGCTEHVARTFFDEFQARGHKASLINIINDQSVDDAIDLLVVCFVVHACNAPEPVMNWIRSLKKVDNKPVIIISVSGGGEVTPNLACRVPMKNAFKRKKYKVVYEKMLVMPSNWIIETKQMLSSRLLQVLPYKVSYIVNDIINGKRYYTYPLIGNRICTLLGTLEHFGAHFFGRNILVTANCNGCGLCVKKCPVSNISFLNNKPVFAGKCILCLSCIYSCPQKALHPKILKFVVIKKGFSFNYIRDHSQAKEDFNLKNETKGFAWLGLRRYLENTSDMLEPTKKID